MNRDSSTEHKKTRRDSHPCTVALNTISHSTQNSAEMVQPKFQNIQASKEATKDYYSHSERIQELNTPMPPSQATDGII